MEPDAEHAYQHLVEGGGQVADAMRAFRTFLGRSDMMAYLAMMAPHLIELKRVLKPSQIDVSLSRKESKAKLTSWPRIQNMSSNLVKMLTPKCVVRDA
jgi:hypothetical protein